MDRSPRTTSSHESLENGGQGLNLTHEVRDGILKHSKGYGKVLPDDPEELACTYEGRVVRMADFMAYLNHDLDDAIRSGNQRIAENPMRKIGKANEPRVSSWPRKLNRPSEAMNRAVMFRPLTARIRTKGTGFPRDLLGSEPARRAEVQGRSQIDERLLVMQPRHGLEWWAEECRVSGQFCGVSG